MGDARSAVDGAQLDGQALDASPVDSAARDASRPDLWPPDAAPTGRLRVGQGPRGVASGAVVELDGVVGDGPAPGAALAFEIYNIGQAPLRFVGDPSIAIAGPHAGDFRVEEMPPSALDPGERAELRIVFEPVEPGPRRARWVLSHDGDGEPSPFVVELEGSARVAAPVFVAVGYGGRRMASLDQGQSWIADAFEVDGDQPSDEMLRDVHCAEAICVAVGGGARARILVTTDGQRWTEVEPPIGAPAFEAITHGAGGWLAVSSQAAWRADDPREWALAADIPGGGALRALTWGAPDGRPNDGRYVAVGTEGRRISSADGRAWEGDVFGGAALSDVAWGNGWFVAVGQAERRLRSADGITWQREVLGRENEFFDDVAFDGARFFASSGIGFFESPDGGAWASRDGFGPRAFAWGADRFVGIAWRDVRTVSEQGLAWQRVAEDDGPPLTAVAFGWLLLDAAPRAGAAR